MITRRENSDNNPENRPDPHTNTSAAESVDEQASSMDRGSALSILGLSEGSDSASVDNRFWQLTKRYRAEGNDDKLREITAAYDVATGRAAARKEEREEYLESKKIFGKTTRQWIVYFSYTWWKYLLAAAGVIFACIIVFQVFFGKDYDFKAVSLGRFTVDNGIITEYAKNRLGYSNPYVVYAELDADGSGAPSTSAMYGPAAAATYLALEPDIVITDEQTLPYYITSVQSLDDFYGRLEKELPPEILSHIKPMKSSVRDYYELTAEDGEEISYSEDEAQTHIYGLSVENPSLFTALGYTGENTESDEALVFCIGASAGDTDAAETFIKSILSGQDAIISEHQAGSSSGKA